MVLLFARKYIAVLLAFMTAPMMLWSLLLKIIFDWGQRSWMMLFPPEKVKNSSWLIGEKHKKYNNSKFYILQIFMCAKLY